LENTPGVDEATEKVYVIKEVQLFKKIEEAVPLFVYNLDNMGERVSG